MSAESGLRKFVPPGSIARGDEYFQRGRVRAIDRTGDFIDATVLGSVPYNVELTIDGDELQIRCECAWYERTLSPCKHVWAVIRAASSRGWLPDRTFDLVPEDPYDDDGVVQFPGPRTEPWQRFLQALGTSIPPQRAHEPKNVPEEIAYVVASYSSSQALTLQILGRAKKKSGEWGRWKQLSLRLDDLHLLPAFDRETIALLHQRAYSHSVESTVVISTTTAAWWVERLARAGRLYEMPAQDEPRPLAWDDGPPWVFRVSIANDPPASVYRITGSIERAGETLPLDRVSGVVSGIVMTEGRAARFDDSGLANWLFSLRASGPIEVPHADTERFRQALLRVPIGNITLPEELGWELVAERPRPLLSLQQNAWSSELHAELFFLYGEWRASSRSQEVQTTIGRKLIRRNRQMEEGFRGRLGALGVIGGYEGFRVRLPQLEEVVRKLATEGWAIELDSAPVRVSDGVDVELSSGIDWFDLEVNAKFGDARVALPELLEAAETKRSLLRLSDGSFGIVPTNWSGDVLAVLELGRKEGDAIRFRPVQALLVDALLESKTATDEAFEAMRARLTTTAPEPAEAPSTLRAELRPYQRAGLGWLQFLRETGVGGCLADDMGLGKTVQALALLDSIRVNKRPSLVVAPRSLLFNWAAEAARFAPELRVREHHGADREKDASAFEDCDLVLTTYATMRLDITHLSVIQFDTVILDEAQAIKNASSQVAKAARLLRGDHRIALSGTPIENHLGELWSLFEFLNPGLLGSSRSFSRTFASKSTPPERRNALARALRPLILRRTKDQVAPELPERTEQTLYCELEGNQRRQYEELRNHYRQSLLARVKTAGLDKSRMQVLEALLRLRQAACHPSLISQTALSEPSAKLDLLFEELQDVLDSGHRALVFSQFTSLLALVRLKLDADRTPYLYLDGRTKDRQSLVNAFQSENGPPLFLISLKAGGLGLNLTNADYIFLLDPWWNPAVEAQAIDRAHRIGRVRPVVAYRLIARDTVEEKILELQARKRELADSIISEDNSVLRKLEVEDLELLLS